nr:TonB-dependent receptor [Sphingomonas kyeonggiensis]
MKISHLLSATALASSVLFVPAVAFAQSSDTSDTATTAATPKEDQESIVVTGSRIRSPNVTSDVPMTSIGGEALLKSANTSIGDELNNLPQLASTFSQQNPGLGIGIAGLNLLDLRGLGTQRTLVLVNGRRHVAADILNNAVSPDVSSIPSNLIERVDIVTGGNSAVYGSDAIAGVVNFILKRNYDGIELRGNAGITEAGFGGNQSISGIVGKNFADGRGNITVSAEYTHQDRVYASDVPWMRQNNTLVTVDSDASSGGQTLVNGSDGFADQIFLRDIRSATINPNGLIAVPQRTGVAACGTGTLASFGAPNTNGTPYNCTYIFTPAGQLIAQTGTRYGAGPTGGILGGNGQTGREGKTVSILPFLERYNANLIAHYEFSPALEFFVEAKWDRVNALGNNAGPSFIQTAAGNNGNVGDYRERVRIDNPFLGTANRTLLTNAVIASGCNISLTAGCPAAGNLTAADITALNNGTYRFQMARNLLDVGLRDEKFQRDTFRVVGGFRGTFNGDWSYEVSANYGRFDQTTVAKGYIDRQRFSLAMDAGLDPVTNTIKCRSQFDPASAVADTRTDDVAVANRAANQARLAADIAACKPYNPFGNGSGNADAINYFSRTFTADASLEQLDFQGFVSGDLSQLFELPGGPIRFALGGEYRRESAYYKQDDFSSKGFTNAVAIPTFSPPDFEVKEAFGEVQVPLLKDVPFFKELTATGAARYSDYGGGTGSVWAYNGGVQWSPISDIRFRANYARAVRAPNVSETGFPLVPNFSTIGDPCNTININTSATRSTNCTTAVGAANLANLTAVNYSLAIVSGSNPNLKAETSDSYTFGAVFQPSFIPGLSLTVDYYNIKVNGVIASVTAQQILNNCYDSATLNNIYCSQFSRYLGTGTGPNGELPGAIRSNSLIVAPLNYANRVRKGIDFDVSYRTRLGANASLNSSLIYVHSIKVSDFQDPTNPKFENRILSEVGYPENEFRFDTDLNVGDVTFGYRAHYIGPMYVGAWENFNGINGVGPANADASEPKKYPAILYSDLRFEWNVANGGRKDAFQFYAGVDNVTNQAPPLGSTATGAGTAIYDFRGRTYYSGFRARF